MMKVSKMKVLRNPLDNEELRDGEHPLTFARAAFAALNLADKGVGDKTDRFALMMKVVGEGDAELTAEEVVLLKSCAKDAFSPLLYGLMAMELDS